jgi:hypothetical protein
MDFTGHMLSEADLRGANLQGVCFKDAMMFNTDLRGADLAGADLRLAVGVQTARWDQTTKWQEAQMPPGWEAWWDKHFGPHDREGQVEWLQDVADRLYGANCTAIPIEDWPTESEAVEWGFAPDGLDIARPGWFDDHDRSVLEDRLRALMIQDVASELYDALVDACDDTDQTPGEEALVDWLEETGAMEKHPTLEALVTQWQGAAGRTEG